MAPKRARTQTTSNTAGSSRRPPPNSGDIEWPLPAATPLPESEELEELEVTRIYRAEQARKKKEYRERKARERQEREARVQKEEQALKASRQRREEEQLARLNPTTDPTRVEFQNNILAAGTEDPNEPEPTDTSIGIRTYLDVSADTQRIVAEARARMEQIAVSVRPAPINPPSITLPIATDEDIRTDAYPSLDEFPPGTHADQDIDEDVKPAVHTSDHLLSSIYTNTGHNSENPIDLCSDPVEDSGRSVSSISLESESDGGLSEDEDEPNVYNDHDPYDEPPAEDGYNTASDSGQDEPDIRMETDTTGNYNQDADSASGHVQDDYVQGDHSSPSNAGQPNPDTMELDPQDRPPAGDSPETALETEEDPIEQIADKLFQQLYYGHHGCSQAEHKDALDAHERHFKKNFTYPQVHNPLTHIAGSVDDFPNFLAQRKLMPKVDVVELRDRLTPATLRQLYCGVNKVLNPDITNPAPPLDNDDPNYCNNTSGTPLDDDDPNYPNRIPNSSSNSSHPTQAVVSDHICLHATEFQPARPDISADIDSSMGFASSLAFARKGINMFTVSIGHQNITSDIHIDVKFRPAALSTCAESNPDETTLNTDKESDPNEPILDIDEDEESDSDVPTQRRRGSYKRAVKLFEIPQILFGRVSNAEELSVYVFFPKLYIGEKRQYRLTDIQLAQWFDQIVYPAVNAAAPPHYTQHLPASYAHALRESLAAQIEQRQNEQKGYNGQYNGSYPLQDHMLANVWGGIIDRIETSGLSHFEGPMIFFSSKGTKLKHKTKADMATIPVLEAMRTYKHYLHTYLDIDYIEPRTFFVDIGKEICSPYSCSPREEPTADSEPQVYTWKTCCLQSYMNWMYDGSPPGASSRPDVLPSGKQQRYWPVAMLRDTAGLTSVTPPQSVHRKGGLLYSQFYSSVKESLDAFKLFPFQSEAIEELAMDPRLIKTAKDLRGGAPRKTETIIKAYLTCKERVDTALWHSRNKSFGTREEHRISWKLFEALLSKLQRKETESQPQGDESQRQGEHELLGEGPNCAWVIPSEEFLDFLHFNYNKFAGGFEMVYANSKQTSIDYAETQIMTMFIRLLAFCFSKSIRSESLLWITQRSANRNPAFPEKPYDTEYGLGFGELLPKYGYCWIDHRLIDWKAMAVHHKYADGILLGNKALKKYYSRNLHGLTLETRNVDRLVQLIKNNLHHDVICDELLDQLAFMSVVQMRIDVIDFVRREVKPKYLKRALDGHKGFCIEYFDRIMEDMPPTINGNKVKYKHPADVIDFLFGVPGDPKDDEAFTPDRRENLNIKPYRKLYTYTYEQLGNVEEFAAQGAFVRKVRHYTPSLNFILPYPSTSGKSTLMQTTKVKTGTQGQTRMWYSITDEKPQNLLPRKQLLKWDKGYPCKWYWARTGYKSGRPGELPDSFTWTWEEWKGWIRRERRVVRD